MCRSPGCLERLHGESCVTLHTCKQERCVHPVQVKSCDNCFPSLPKNIINVNFEINRRIICLFQYYLYSCLLLVSDVAGVVDPHQLTETLTPPRGQIEPHVEGVLSLRRWVPPAEPIPLKLGHFLLTNNSLQAEPLSNWFTVLL